MTNPIKHPLPYRSRTDAERLIAELIADEQQTDSPYVAHPLQPGSRYFVVIAYDDTGRYRGSIK